MLSSLINDMKRLDLHTNALEVNISDDEFIAIPELVGVVKNKITELTENGSVNEKMTVWIKKEYDFSFSIKKLMIISNESASTTLANSPDVLKAPIKDLIRIHSAILTL